MSRNSTLLDQLKTGTIDRRHLVGGAAGIVTAATAAFAVGSLVSAQTATPEAGSTSNSTAADRAKAITDRSAAVIASVKADRDAVASSIDVASVDELLSLASDLQTKAEAATVNSSGMGRKSSGSTSSSSSSASATPSASTGTGAASTTATTTAPGKIELAAAAVRTAQAARAIMVAQMAKFGLPSQQARLSKKLAEIYAAVKEIATSAGTAGVADASTLVTHAEAAYKSAYDAYNAKTYASAAAYGEATVELGEAAAVLLGLGMRGGMKGRGGRMDRQGDRGGFWKSAKDGTEATSGTDDMGTPESSSSSDGSGSGSSDDSSTPVEVPQPTF